MNIDELRSKDDQVNNATFTFRCACCNQPRTSFMWSGTKPYCARCWRRIWSER